MADLAFSLMSHFEHYPVCNSQDGQVDYSETAEIAEVSFHSQTKYSPLIITFVQGVNSNLEFFSDK